VPRGRGPFAVRGGGSISSGSPAVFAEISRLLALAEKSPTDRPAAVQRLWEIYAKLERDLAVAERDNRVRINRRLEACVYKALGAELERMGEKRVGQPDRADPRFRGRRDWVAPAPRTQVVANLSELHAEVASLLTRAEHSSDSKERTDAISRLHQIAAIVAADPQ